MALTKRYTAAALILAGAFVNLYEVEGFPFMRNADAELGYPADGFVGSDVASGARGNVYFPGSINRDLSGLTLNTDYFLTTTGDVSDEVSAGEGDVRQKLGRAISSTQLIFAPADVPVDGGGAVNGGTAGEILTSNGGSAATFQHKMIFSSFTANNPITDVTAQNSYDYDRTVTGASVGDLVIVTNSGYTPPKLVITAYVYVSDTVRIRFSNIGTTTITTGGSSNTWGICVIKP